MTAHGGSRATRTSTTARLLDPSPRAPAPGRRTLTGELALGDPLAILQLRLREARGRLAALREDQAAGRLSPFHLRCGLDEVDRDLADARALAAEQGDREAIARVDELQVEADATRDGELPHRAALERSFGEDFSTVRARTGVTSLRDAGAVATAEGETLSFADAEPTEADVAHELTHVVQRRRAGAGGAKARSSRQDPAEVEAEQVEAAVARGAAASSIPIAAAPSAAVQRKEAGAEEKPSPKRLPDGANYAVGPRPRQLWVRRPWLGDGGPAKVLELLRFLAREQVFGWADDDDLVDASDEIELWYDEALLDEVVLIELSANVYAMIGLPAASVTEVERRGDGLDVMIRTDDLVDARSGPLELSDDLKVRFVTALYVFTSLEVLPGWQAAFMAAPITAQVRAGTAYFTLSGDGCRDAFGAEAWDAWLATPVEEIPGASGGGGRGGASADVDPTLTEEELAKIKEWLAAHMGNGAGPGSGLPLSRALLELIERIDESPHAEKIYAALAERDGEATSRLRLLEALVFDVEREEAGFDETGSEPFAAPEHGYPVPARIDQQAGLVVEHEAVPFTVVIDRPPLSSSHRGDWTHVDWAFEREVDGKVQRQRASMTSDTDGRTIEHRFELEPGESEATFTVVAFVQHSHFLPKKVETPVVVKSREARMAELIGAATEGLGSFASEEASFDLGVVDGIGAKVASLVNGGAYDTGVKFEGVLPESFRHAPPSERLARIDADIQTAEEMIAYFESHAGATYDDAIAAARHHLARLRDARTAIEQDLAGGWHAFECRGTYLSRKARTQDGALELYGMVQKEVLPLGERVKLQIRDLSRRYEASNYRFEQTGPTFEAAFKATFLDLCKSYPAGRVALLAEVVDPATGESTGATLGYELDTGNATEDVSDLLFDPKVNLALNLAGIAAMIFVPGAAPFAFAALATYNTAQTLEQLAELHTKGTLTLERATLSMASIALDLLPLASRIKPLATSARALFYLELADTVGDVALMTAEARAAIFELRQGEISQMAELYARMVDLEGSTHPSDPALVGLRKELDAGVQRIRDATTTVLTGLIEQRALFFMASRTFQTMNRARLDADQAAARGSGVMIEGAGIPRYEERSGRIVGDPSKLTDEVWELATQRQREHLGTIASELDVMLDLPAGTTRIEIGEPFGARWKDGALELTYTPGISPASAKWLWKTLAAEAPGRPEPTSEPSTDARPDPSTAPRGGRSPEALADLDAQLPLGLRGQVPIVENDQIEGAGVRVVYTDGDLRIEVGPDARPRHVRYHAGTAEWLLRYRGPIGLIRRLIDAIKTKLRITPGHGTEGFEARAEVLKLQEIKADLEGLLARLDQQVERSLADGADELDAQALAGELADVVEQLEYYRPLVDSYEPGRGFVAAEGDKKGRPGFRIAIRHDSLWEETTVVEGKAYQLDFFGADHTGARIHLGFGQVPIDADGKVVGAPTFNLTAEAPRKDRLVPLEIREGVVIETDADGEAVTRGTGKRTSFTRYALSTFLERYVNKFGHEPDTLPGRLGADNRLYFQQAWYRYHVLEKMSVQDAAQAAILKTPFGGRRFELGYGEFEITLGEIKSTELGEELGTQRVPSTIEVIARRSGT